MRSILFIDPVGTFSQNWGNSGVHNCQFETPWCGYFEAPNKCNKQKHYIQSLWYLPVVACLLNSIKLAQTRNIAGTTPWIGYFEIKFLILARGLFFFFAQLLVLMSVPILNSELAQNLKKSTTTNCRQTVIFLHRSWHQNEWLC